mmetsp:Transcript_34556/g.78964  ORF Transcript_34556/g.78964 Transcript_34556/m.78964 type:complete len:408 (-) Transcript_34556:87-1310(-)
MADACDQFRVVDSKDKVRKVCSESKTADSTEQVLKLIGLYGRRIGKEADGCAWLGFQLPGDEYQIVAIPQALLVCRADDTRAEELPRASMYRVIEDVDKIRGTCERHSHEASDPESVLKAKGCSGNRLKPVGEHCMALWFDDVPGHDGLINLVVPKSLLVPDDVRPKAEELPKPLRGLLDRLRPQSKAEDICKLENYFRTLLLQAIQKSTPMDIMHQFMAKQLEKAADATDAAQVCDMIEKTFSTQEAAEILKGPDATQRVEPEANEGAHIGADGRVADVLLSSHLIAYVDDASKVWEIVQQAGELGFPQPEVNTGLDSVQLKLDYTLESKGNALVFKALREFARFGLPLSFATASHAHVEDQHVEKPFDRPVCEEDLCFKMPCKWEECEEDLDSPRATRRLPQVHL